MKSGEKVLFAAVVFLVVLICAAAYLLLFFDAGTDPGPNVSETPPPEIPWSEGTEEPPEVVSDIDGEEAIDAVVEDLPDETVKDRGTFIGKVLAEDKKPVVDARVFLYRTKTPGVLVFSRRPTSSRRLNG